MSLLVKYLLNFQNMFTSSETAAVFTSTHPFITIITELAWGVCSVAVISPTLLKRQNQSSFRSPSSPLQVGSIVCYCCCRSFSLPLHVCYLFIVILHGIELRTVVLEKWPLNTNVRDYRSIATESVLEILFKGTKESLVLLCCIFIRKVIFIVLIPVTVQGCLRVCLS